MTSNSKAGDTYKTDETDDDVAEDMFWSDEAQAYVTYPEFMKLKYGIEQKEPLDVDD